MHSNSSGRITYSFGWGNLCWVGFRWFGRRDQDSYWPRPNTGVAKRSNWVSAYWVRCRVHIFCLPKGMRWSCSLRNEWWGQLNKTDLFCDGRCCCRLACLVACVGKIDQVYYNIVEILGRVSGRRGSWLEQCGRAIPAKEGAPLQQEDLRKGDRRGSNPRPSLEPQSERGYPSLS
jgi:hypothetical protein